MFSEVVMSLKYTKIYSHTRLEEKRSYSRPN